MKININAFGGHPDSAENRGCIKDVDFLGQIDTLLGGNPTDEQLEEVRKTLFGTNKAWVPRWMFDDLVNVPVGPEPEPEPQQPNDEIWYTSSDGNIVTPNLVRFGDGITVIDNIYENGKGVIKLSSDITTIGIGAFSGRNGLTTVTIPNSVTSIGDEAFMNCQYLTSIIIPNNVTAIGVNAFADCKRLIVNIPDSVTTIGYYAFGQVQHISYNGSATGSPWGAKYINGYYEDDFLYDSTKTILIKYFGNDSSVIIPDTVTNIGNGAFSDCVGLTSITIPNSVTSIGESAFQNCSGLTSFIIPDNITTISLYTFSGCTGLTSITIPNSVTTIDNYAFLGCTGLPSITIPNGVTRIGYGVFLGCTGLPSITIPNSVTSIGSQAFKNIPHIYYNGSATGSPWGALVIN